MCFFVLSVFLKKILSVYFNIKPTPEIILMANRFFSGLGYNLSFNSDYL
jgi:hypothetical protein